MRKLLSGSGPAGAGPDSPGSCHDEHSQGASSLFPGLSTLPGPLTPFYTNIATLPLAELARAALTKAQGVEHPAANAAYERVLARSATSYESRLAAQEASERAPSVLAGIQEAAEAAGRMHAIWEVFCGRSADATPEDLCLAYVRAYFDFWGRTLPDLTTDQAVQWVGRHVPTLYENLFRTSSSKAVRSSSGVRP